MSNQTAKLYLLTAEALMREARDLMLTAAQLSDDEDVHDHAYAGAIDAQDLITLRIRPALSAIANPDKSAKPRKRAA